MQEKKFEEAWKVLNQPTMLKEADMFELLKLRAKCSEELAQIKWRSNRLHQALQFFKNTKADLEKLVEMDPLDDDLGDLIAGVEKALVAIGSLLNSPFRGEDKTSEGSPSIRETIEGSDLILGSKEGVAIPVTSFDVDDGETIGWGSSSVISAQLAPYNEPSEVLISVEVAKLFRDNLYAIPALKLRLENIVIVEGERISIDLNGSSDNVTVALIKTLEHLFKDFSADPAALFFEFRWVLLKDKLSIDEIPSSYVENFKHLEQEQKSKQQIEVKTLHYKIEHAGAPFLEAARLGDLEKIKLLQQQGVDVQVRNKQGETALHVSARYGHEEVVKWLFGLKDDVLNLKNMSFSGTTPLMSAVEGGQVNMIRFLADQGADFSLVRWSGGGDKHKNFAVVGEVVQHGDTILHSVAESGNQEVMNCLLQLPNVKWDLEAKGVFNRTPFLSAAASGQLEIMRLLKDLSVHLSVIDSKQNDALNLAILGGYFDVVNWLLGLNIPEFFLTRKISNVMPPVLVAVASGRLEMLKLLISRGGSFLGRDSRGNTALHVAAYFGHAEVMEYLLDLPECKVLLEVKNSSGITPILCAAMKGQLGAVNLLKDRGANTRVKDSEGSTILHLGVDSGNESLVGCLLGWEDLAFNLETKGFGGRTPVLYAAANGQFEMLKFLKERGANMHARDNEGSTSLHLAVNSGNQYLVMWLLNFVEMRSLLEERGFFDRTPLLYAAANRFASMVVFLKSQGANICAKGRFQEDAEELFLLPPREASFAFSYKYTPVSTPSRAFGPPGQTYLEKKRQEQQERLAQIRSIPMIRREDIYSSWFFSTVFYEDIAADLLITSLKKTPAIQEIKRITREKGKQLCIEMAGKKDDIAVAALIKTFSELESSFVLQAEPVFDNAGVVFQIFSCHLLRLEKFLIDSTFFSKYYCNYIELEKILALRARAGAREEWEQKNEKGETLFLEAAKAGDLDLMKSLKDQGANIVARNDYNRTAFDLAASKARVDVVSWLVTLDATEFNLKSSGQYSLDFLSAISHGAFELFCQKYTKTSGHGSGADHRKISVIEKPSFYAGGAAPHHGSRSGTGLKNPSGTRNIEAGPAQPGASPYQQRRGPGGHEFFRGSVVMPHQEGAVMREGYRLSSNNGRGVPLARGASAAPLYPPPSFYRGNWGKK